MKEECMNMLLKCFWQLILVIVNMKIIHLNLVFKIKHLNYNHKKLQNKDLLE